MAAQTIDTYPKIFFCEKVATISENIPNAGNDQNIDLGMAPHPNEIEVHHLIAAESRRKEMHIQKTVEPEKKCRCGKHGKCGDNKNHAA